MHIKRRTKRRLLVATLVFLLAFGIVMAVGSAIARHRGETEEKITKRPAYAWIMAWWQNFTGGREED